MIQPFVTIIILNWNGLENTKKCLSSILQNDYKNYKVIVIDNGSKNDEAKIIKKEFGDRIKVHSLKTNLGFTGGCNYGISLAQKNNPDYYLLLNNDTVVDKKFLTNLVLAVSSDKNIGIASPVIYDLQKKDKIIFSGGYINWSLGKTFHKTNLISSLQPCTFITGCCLFIKKEVIDKIGLLDDRFFAYFEDAAFSVRANQAGYKCVCVPNSKIFHKESGSSDKKGSFKTYLIARNRILFVNNYAPLIVKYYFFVFNFIKLIFALLYFVLTSQKKRSYAYFQGYRDGTLGKGGYPNI